jgi:hypothetical protein
VAVIELLWMERLPGHEPRGGGGWRRGDPAHLTCGCESHERTSDRAVIVVSGSSATPCRHTTKKRIRQGWYMQWY